MRRFYRFFPTIIRVRDQLASGFDPAPFERDLPTAGADGSLLGEAAAYRWDIAGHDLDNYQTYWIETEVTGSSPRRDKFTPTPGERKIRFDYFTEADAPHHFKVAVYDDRRMRPEDMVFSADSSVDVLGWSIIREAVMEKIVQLLDEEGLTTELLIDDFPDLVDVDRVSPSELVLLSVFLGTLLDGTKPLDFRRWFVRNLVALYKIKGTAFSWKKQQQLTLVTVTEHVELYKTVPNEKCDYSRVKDDAHQLKSARFALLGVCASSYETGLEQEELPRSAVREVLDVIEAVRPVHVILRQPCKTFDFVDEFPLTTEELLPIEGLGSVLDSFPATVEDLQITRSCVSTAQIDCISCCETECTSCEAFACESDACQVGCTQSCTAFCEGTCQFGTTGGGGGGGGCETSLQEGGCDKRTEGSCGMGVTGGCGGVNPLGGTKCQTFKQIPNPPQQPFPECITYCTVGQQQPVAACTACQVAVQPLNPPPEGPWVMVRTVVTDPEFGENFRDSMVPITQVPALLREQGFTPVRTEGGGVELTTSSGGGLAEAGEPQGLVVSNTGEPCNRCPSVVTGTISTGATAYPQQAAQQPQQPNAGGQPNPGRP